MGKRKLPDKILEQLRKAREHATLADASFDWPDSHMTATCRSGDFDGRPDDFIKEQVRIYHQTWIIGPLDRVIAWGEGKSDTDLRSF